MFKSVFVYIFTSVYVCMYTCMYIYKHICICTQIEDLTLKVKVYEDENTSLGKGLGGKNKKLKGEMNDLQIILTRRTGLGNWYAKTCIFTSVYVCIYIYVYTCIHV